MGNFKAASEWFEDSLMPDLQPVSMTWGDHRHVFRYENTPLGRTILLMTLWDKENDEDDPWTSYETAVIWNVVDARARGYAMERAER